MRHRKAGVKLNRTSSHRDAMFRNMVTSLFKHQRIRTTDAKAKELRRWADHIITLAKRGDLHARRQAMAIVREKAVVHQLFEDASDHFGDISGGYTRVVKVGRRPGDAAPVSIIELVKAEDRSGKKKPAKKKAAPQPAAAPAVQTQAAPSTEAADAPQPAAEAAADQSADPPPDPAPADGEAPAKDGGVRPEPEA